MGQNKCTVVGPSIQPIESYLLYRNISKPSTDGHCGQDEDTLFRLDGASEPDRTKKQNVVPFNENDA